jgi:hypothetical protein
MATNIAAVEAWVKVEEAEREAKEAGARYAAAQQKHADAKRTYQEAVQNGWK